MSPGWGNPLPGWGNPPQGPVQWQLVRDPTTGRLFYQQVKPPARPPQTGAPQGDGRPRLVGQPKPLGMGQGQATGSSATPPNRLTPSQIQAGQTETARGRYLFDGIQRQVQGAKAAARNAESVAAQDSEQANLREQQARRQKEAQARLQKETQARLQKEAQVPRPDLLAGGPGAFDPRVLEEKAKAALSDQEPSRLQMAKEAKLRNYRCTNENNGYTLKMSQDRQSLRLDYPNKQYGLMLPAFNLDDPKFRNFKKQNPWTINQYDYTVTQPVKLPNGEVQHKFTDASCWNLAANNGSPKRREPRTDDDGLVTMVAGKYENIHEYRFYGSLQPLGGKRIYPKECKPLSSPEDEVCQFITIMPLNPIKDSQKKTLDLIRKFQKKTDSGRPISNIQEILSLMTDKHFKDVVPGFIIAGNGAQSGGGYNTNGNFNPNPRERGQDEYIYESILLAELKINIENSQTLKQIEYKSIKDTLLEAIRRSLNAGKSLSTALENVSKGRVDVYKYLERSIQDRLAMINQNLIQNWWGVWKLYPQYETVQLTDPSKAPGNFLYDLREKPIDEKNLNELIYPSFRVFSPDDRTRSDVRPLTRQGEIYTYADHDSYSDAFGVFNVHMRISSFEDILVDAVWVHGPNLSATFGVTGDTVNHKAIDDATSSGEAGVEQSKPTFRESVKTAVRAGLDLLIRRGTKHVVINQISTGIYGAEKNLLLRKKAFELPSSFEHETGARTIDLAVRRQYSKWVDEVLKEDVYYENIGEISIRLKRHHFFDYILINSADYRDDPRLK